MTAPVTCRECGHPVSAGDRTCHNCGTPAPAVSRRTRNITTVVAAVLILAALAFCMGVG